MIILNSVVLKFNPFSHHEYYNVADNMGPVCLPLISLLYSPDPGPTDTQLYIYKWTLPHKGRAFRAFLDGGY